MLQFVFYLIDVTITFPSFYLGINFIFFYLKVATYITDSVSFP